MNIQKTFNMVFGMNLHFYVLDYSVLKYGTNTKAAAAKYESLSNAQKTRYEWLMRRFVSTQDLVYACIGCQLSEVNMVFGSKDDITDAFLKFKGRRDAMSYSLNVDIKKHKDGGFIATDKLIFKYLIDEISPEYVILLSHGTNDLEDLYNSPNLSWAKDKVLKLMKYRDFFNSSKYLHLIEKNEHQLSV